MLAGQANMSKSSMHLAYDVCRAEARHIHKVHHEFKAGRVAVQSQSNLFFVEDGEADEYLSGKDWATEASQAPMGLAAIYCHPLEFFLSDLMYFPQTITVPSTTATNPLLLWRTEDCWTGWMSSQALECKGPHNPIQPMGEAALAHARTVFPISKAFGCWPGCSPNKWLHWCWSLSWTEGRKSSFQQVGTVAPVVVPTNH